MTSGGYEVQFQELLNGGKAFHTQSGVVQKLLEQWHSAANLDPSVFGNLAVSQQMASGYEEFFSQTAKDITTLYKALESGSVSLVSAAGVYYAAETALAANMQYLSEVATDNKYLDRLDSGEGP